MNDSLHKFSKYLLDPIPDELWRHSEPISGAKLGFCDNCRFYHLDPYPTDDYLANYYKNYEMPTPQANLSITARLLGRYIEKSASIIDMGCGDGGFLLEMQKLGFSNLSGFDQSPGVQRAQKLGLGEISNKSVWEFLNETERNETYDADAYVMVNVLEHIPEPINLLHRLYKVMKEGAVLAVTVPNDFSPLQKAFLKSKGHLPWFVCLPDHLNYFDFNTLKYTLEDNGFTEIDRSALYPLELFLLQDLDYIDNPELGSIAHQRRVTFEESLKNAGMEDVLDDFYQTLASGGYGRDVMMIAQKK